MLSVAVHNLSKLQSRLVHALSAAVALAMAYASVPCAEAQVSNGVGTTVAVSWTASIPFSTGLLRNVTVSGGGGAAGEGFQQSGVFTQGSAHLASPVLSHLEVNRPYLITLEAYRLVLVEGQYEEIPQSFTYALQAFAIPGYRVQFVPIVGSSVTESISGSGLGLTELVMTVVSADGCGSCDAGVEYDLSPQEDRVSWSVSLGRTVAGGVVPFVEYSVSSVTSGVFGAAQLNFVSTQAGVFRIPATGNLRQVRTPSALMTVTELFANGQPSGIELKFYTAIQITGGTHVNDQGWTTTGNPYVTYRWENTTPGTAPTIVRFTRTGATSLILELRRSAAAAGNPWSRHTPNTPGSGSIATTSGGNVETREWRDPVGTVVRRELVEYRELPGVGRREIVRVTDGEGRQSNWSYFTEDMTTLPGALGRQDWQIDERGQWSVRGYHNEAGPYMGQLVKVWRPYQDGAPLVGPMDEESYPSPRVRPPGIVAVLEGPASRWTAYQWTLDWSGNGKLPASEVEYVNDGTGGVIVRQTSWTHVFDPVGATTPLHVRNGRRLLRTTQREFSSPGSSVESIRVSYADSPDNPEPFRGRTHAALRADGTQTSYVNVRGTWVPGGGGTAGAGSGPGDYFATDPVSGGGDDWLEVEIHGFRDADSSLGTTLRNTEWGQAIEPIYLIAEQSTAIARVLKAGYVVREDTYVWHAEAWHFVARTAREYAGFGAPTREARWTSTTKPPAGRLPANHGLVETVLYEATYNADLRRVSERGADGVLKEMEYDALGRLIRERHTGRPGADGTYGAHHTQELVFEYDAASNLTRRILRSPGHAEELTWIYAYDLGGRLKSVTEPSTAASGGVRTSEFAASWVGGAFPTTGFWQERTSLPGVVGAVVVPTGTLGTPAVATAAIAAEFQRDGVKVREWGPAVIEQAWLRSNQGTSVLHRSGPLGDPARTEVTSTFDWLGRVTLQRTHRPATVFGGQADHEGWGRFVYDAAGRLVRRTFTQVDNGPNSRGELADVLYAYDVKRGLVYTGLDLNNNRELDLGPVDRASWRRSFLHNMSIPAEYTRPEFGVTQGAWWLRQDSGIVESTNSLRTLQATDTQVGGLGTNVAALTRDLDAHGGVVVRRTTLDRSNHVRSVETRSWVQGLETQPGATGSTVVTSAEALDRVVNGRPEFVRNHALHTFHVRHDALGRIEAQIDPRLGATTFSYHAGTPLLLAERSPSNAANNLNTRTYAYDAAGRMASIVRADGSTIFQAYTPRGELWRTWGSAVHPFEQQFDAVGRRISLAQFRTGGAGQSLWNGPAWPASPGSADTTRWHFEPLSGVLVRKEYPERTPGQPVDDRSVRYTYTQDGLLATRLWARRVGGQPTGQAVTTTYGYNGKTGELTTRSYNDQVTQSVTLNRNDRGQVTSATASPTSGSHPSLDRIDYSYSPTGSLLSETFGPFLKSRRLNHAYSHPDGGRRTSITLEEANGADLYRMGYEFADGDGRLERLTTWSTVGGAQDRRRTYEYHANSTFPQFLRYRTPGSEVAHFERETFLRADTDTIFVLRSRDLLQGQPGLVRMDVWTVRDDLGRIIHNSYDNAPEDPHPLFRGYSSQGDRIATYYGYSSRDELVEDRVVARVNGQLNDSSLYQPDALGAHRGRHYWYDAAGNRLERRLAMSGNPPPAITYAPNAQNQLTSGSHGALVYDLDGNLLDDGEWTYTYDAENRLIRQDKKGTNVRLQHFYDHLHRRWKVQLWDGTAQQWSKRFIHDDMRVIADFWDNVEDEANFANAFFWGLEATNTLGGAGGVGGLVEVHYNNLSFIPLQDDRGNIFGYQRADERQTVSWDMTSTGEILHERGTITTNQGQTLLAGSWDFRFRYQTKWQDAGGSPLHLYGYRFYHAGLGRFLNRDPLEEPGGHNLYAKVRNNFPNGWDHLGLFRRHLDGGGGEDDIIRLPPFVVTADYYTPPPTWAEMQIIQWKFRMQLKPYGGEGGEGGGGGGGGQEVPSGTEWSEEECEQLRKDIIDAYISKAGYDGIPPPGYNAGQVKVDSRTGFRAQQFVAQDGSDRVTTYAGTNPSEIGDWRADVQQLIGHPVSTQYDFAKEVVSEFPRPTRYVGHSLGGGLAHLSGVLSRVPAVTFNAAALHPNTLYHYYGSAPAAVQPRNLVLQSDIVTRLQAGFAQRNGFTLHSGVVIVYPDSRAQRLLEPDAVFQTEMHKIGAVISTLESLYREHCQ